MSYPTNIVPGISGANLPAYDALSIMQPVTYVRLRGNVYQAAIGAKSRAKVDVPFYDTSTTRDVIDAGFMGRGPMSVMHGNTSSGAVTVVNGDIYDTNSAAPAVPTADEVATMMQQSDPFTHIAPHQNVLAQTEIRYYDGPVVSNLPTGNLLASFPYTQWVGDGSTIPQIDGSAYPTINPDDNNTDVS